MSGRIAFPSLLMVLIATFVSGKSPCFAQSSARALLSAVSTAFSNGRPVQQLQLSGTAEWYAGSVRDSGTALLSLDVNGNVQMRLLLGTLGERTESQSGVGEALSCEWSEGGNTPTSVTSMNCWRPLVWFLPAFSLQPTTLPEQSQFTDLGLGSVGFGDGAYRHLRGSFSFSDLSAPLAENVARASISDLGLDPGTMLPSVLTYAVLPDDGSNNPIAIEIHYSQYQTINSVQIPFRIERYVNGVLQLVILIDSVQ